MTSNTRHLWQRELENGKSLSLLCLSLFLVLLCLSLSPCFLPCVALLAFPESQSPVEEAAQDEVVATREQRASSCRQTRPDSTRTTFERSPRLSRASRFSPVNRGHRYANGVVAPLRC